MISINSTFAWFTATSAASVSAVANSAEVTVDASTYSAGTFYVKASAALGAAKLDYTDYQGNCWVISNGYLRAATAKYATYTTVVVSVKFYTTEACDVEVTDAGDLANIGAKYDYVTVTINPDANTRLTTANPAAPETGVGFATAFSSKLDVSDNVTANIAAAGTISSYTNNTHYVSVNGDGTAEAGSAHSDGQTGQSSTTTPGGLALTCVLHERS